MSAYTVDERERAILLKLGKIEQADIGPGLHWKLPFVNNVRYFSSQVLTLDAPPERFLTSEKKNVIVNFFVKWRIDDLVTYFRATRGSEAQAQLRLAQIIKDGLRNEFGERTIQETVSKERSQITEVLRIKANELTDDLGIKVVDVRITSISLPEEVSESVYERMRAERDRVAKDFRARGREAAERIRAEADRKRTVILAEAYRYAERLRGEGDAKAAEIYARAYGQDKDFYDFYRSLEAYRQTFSGKDDLILLDEKSEFFRYFGKSK
ncbi:MAG: protease modulator HflC [Gammaproteobacteria bacterium]|nr:MAG: protease modulator HflC [Gammaproteobacteria bacterium]